MTKRSVALVGVLIVMAMIGSSVIGAVSAFATSEPAPGPVATSSLQDVQTQEAGEPIHVVIEPQHARLPVYTEPPTFTAEQLAEMQAMPHEINLPGPPVPMVSDDAGFLGAETVVPFDTLATEGPAADSDFEIFRSTDLRDTASLTNVVRGVNEPSLDAHNDSIFWTGNGYAALSTDRGQAWGYVNPRDFPTANAGFCCDQVVIYDPGNDIMIWLLQYHEDGTTNTDRIAVAHGYELRPDLAWTEWTYYDFNPQHFGYPTNRWFDYPRMAVTDNFLYVTSVVSDIPDGYRRGSATWRIPLSELAAGGGINASGYPLDEHHLMPTLGPTDRMYFGTHIDNSSLRLFTWLDSSSSWSTSTLTHDAYPSSDRFKHDCPTTEPGDLPGDPPINICRWSDDRILGGWASSNIIGFMWNAADGLVGQTSFPWPYVEVVRYNESTLEKIDQPRIWSNSVAWIFPGVAPNFNGHIAGPIFAVSGPSNLYPQLNLFIWDDYTPDPVTNGWEVYFVRGSTNAYFFTDSKGKPRGRWGDYVTSRQYRAYSNTWIGAGFTMQGGADNKNAHPQFVWFGRERDAPPVNTCNDDFGCPLTISADIGLPSFTAYATTAVDDPIIPTACAFSAGLYPRQSRSVWYEFTPTATGPYTVSTSGSTYDTVLAIWTGSRGSLSLVECDDNGGGSDFSSKITRSFTAGATYYLEGMRYGSGPGGTLWMNVTSVPCYTLTTSVSPGGSGSVTPTPASNCPGGKYTSGTVVTLTANANPGWTFNNWSGNASGSANPTSITMDADKSVTANNNNVAPVVTATGGVINENGVATVSGTITDPGTQDTFTVVIDWGEGSPQTYNYGAGTTAYSETHQYLDDNPTATASDIYSVGVTVTDDDLGVGTASTTVTVNNVNPVASIDHITDDVGNEIGVDVPVALVGLVIDIEGSFTDVGTQDTHTASINWDDGTVDDATGTTAGSHAYATPDMYTIELTVTDDDNGTDVSLADVTVVDAFGAITALIGELSTLPENANIAQALDKLIGENGGDAENGALDQLARDNLNATLEQIKQAMQELEAAEARDASLDLTILKSLLALTAKSVAVDALERAEATARNPAHDRKIQNAANQITEGDGLLAARDYVGAVDSYQEAVREASSVF